MFFARLSEAANRNSTPHAQAVKLTPIKNAKSTELRNSIKSFPASPGEFEPGNDDENLEHKLEPKSELKANVEPELKQMSPNLREKLIKERVRKITKSDGEVPPSKRRKSASQKKKAVRVYSSYPVYDEEEKVLDKIESNATTNLTLNMESENVIVDLERTIFHPFDKHDNISVIYAKDLIDSGYTRLFDDTIEYTLELPFGKEQYVASRSKNVDLFDPLAETDSLISVIASHFVPKEYAVQIKDPDMKNCILRRIRRALKIPDKDQFMESITQFNELMKQMRTSGQIEQIIMSFQLIDHEISNEILNQVYVRVVSPRTNELRNYKAFSNNVYGELLPSFVNKIFQQSKLKSSSVFIDLGSGVGNCVLQAALEVGCESWGCEMMKAASDLASLQQTEFENRVKVYGLSCGPIHLRSADFVHNAEIQEVLKRADVVLVNNYAFDSKLNGHLIDMFLDLKEGCKVVSLKTFVPPDHVISDFNIESPLNILSVEKFHFPNGSVSWTNADGQYFISTIDRSRIAQSSKTRRR